MKARCIYPTHVSYHLYGGRGIKVCERWMNSYAAFISDMGEAPIGMSLDRFPNNNGNYEPGNCRWATNHQQGLNRSQNVRYTHNGETLTQSEWASRLGIDKSSLLQRIASGWPLAKALTQKPRKYSRRTSK